MPPHLTLVIPCLNQYSRLQRMLETVRDSTVQPDQIIIIDNGGKLSRYVFPGYDIYTPKANLGVAGSCNQALRMTRDWWFHCNDDVELAPDLIEKMRGAIIQDEEDPDAPEMYIPDYGAGSAFSVFMMHHAVPWAIGWFDENFFPIYFEDNCFGYRMNLAGVKRKVVEGCKYVHHTSSTVNGFDAEGQAVHHANFLKLKEYYIQKWGGPPEQERFSKPFDGGSVIDVDKSWWKCFGRES